MAEKIASPSAVPSCWEVASSPAAPARISAQTGRLTNSTHRQPGPCDSTPPRNTPAAAASPEIAPQVPSARLRSVPWLNVVVRMDSPAGAIIAAPAPCPSRAPISMPALAARPPASEQAGGAAAEQQQPPVGDQVAGQDPLQVLHREAQAAPDRRQGDVHDRGVGDVEELDRAQQQQREPAGSGREEGTVLGGH